MQLQRPSFIQEQRLKMTPQLYQSIKLMELPVADLRETIEAELERNPALEVVADHTVVSLEALELPPKETDTYFETSSDAGFIRRGGDEAADEQHRFIEGVLARKETLQDHLLWQLRLEPIDLTTRQLGELVIQNLNEDGFHKEPVALLLKDTPLDLVRKVLRQVQVLDPVGTATADYREALQVQCELLPDPPVGIVKALSYLELLERGKFAEVAKKLDCTVADVEEMFECIRELSPFPGRCFASGETRYVIPDVQVIKKAGELVIMLNDEEIPVLGISPFFMKLRHDSKHKQDRPVRDFVQENIKEARWFIYSINQRNHTLLKVSRAVVACQRPFFERGPQYLAPLTLGDIAGELGVHETTVSRTANGKYLQTEWGVYELRHFFSNSISGSGSGGSQYSKEGVKEIIRELISDEDRHFSDQEIAGLLAKRGIPLARRTVAKYRNELDLGSSYAR
ncbi:MAG: RNA polymerase factor sigma-54 [Treponema sp.]|nr:RNA polymerase factor sigma-54 [Treponema sp.]